MDPHYSALFPAYIAASISWFIVYRKSDNPWKNETNITFQRPGLELLFSCLAVACIILIGQLYMAGWLILNDGNVFIDALNQVLIFSPSLLLLSIRKQSTLTAWLPLTQIPIRIFWGLFVSMIALLVYSLARYSIYTFPDLIIHAFNPKQFSHLVQVFMEDVTIAVLFVRLAALIQRRNALILVCALFAAGHIPAMISSGFAIQEMGSLLMDTAIGLIILSAVSKSQDIWWFFVLHFALDVTQFFSK